MNEAFLSHYWQNTVFSNNCSEPDTTDPYNSLGDGRGRYRNNPDPIPQIGFPISTGNVDYRGKIFVWGSIVQRKRGYIMRNFPGPYDSGDIGYDKYYRYDYNLLDSPPPNFPTIENNEGATILTFKSYGQSN
ncbi:MAG: hypothetical protein HQ510_04000 [Candidatus Marinimicrobia bacterium]|nr:hypothetical protein [Candidatus Neomarinimicrobiota bacterium]